MTTYFEYYGDLGLQRFMVSDERRTDAFARAILEVVQKGDLVLDVGTGTGILAMLAARAGASHVFAIDQARITETVTELLRHNGLNECVTVLEGNAKDLTLASKVDVLISEWLGQMAFEENMLLDVLTARDKNLKPGGKMLPSGVDVLLAPICDPELYEQWGPGFWSRPVQGLDLSPLEGTELRQARAQRTRIPPEALISPGQSLVSLDLTCATATDPWASGTIRFEVDRAATFHGFAGWFTAHLSPSVSLDTGPSHPITHWSQSYFAFPPVSVQQGQIIEVDFALSRLAHAPRGIEVALRTMDHSLHFALD